MRGWRSFFQNTEIHEKDADVGEPSRENIMLLRQNKLIPIETLMAVDVKSPYYHEEEKGSIFYAESWALVHMLEAADGLLHTHRLPDYIDIVSQHVDPVTAGDRALGDLHQLQKALEMYISRSSFSYMKADVPQDVNEASFQAAAIAPAEANAVRADFLAYNDRGKDARALLTLFFSKTRRASLRTRRWAISSFGPGTLRLQASGMSRRFSWIHRVTWPITITRPSRCKAARRCLLIRSSQACRRRSS